MENEDVMGSMGNLILLVLPIAGSMLIALGVFQVVMDLRTTKQRKIVGRLKEARKSSREQQVKESLLRQRAAELQGSFFEGLVSKPVW